MRTTTSRHCPAPLDSHSGDGCHSLETSWVPDHLVQGVDDLCKSGPAIAILLPTVQHELVEGGGAVWGRGQPVVLFNSIDHLQRQGGLGEAGLREPFTKRTTGTLKPRSLGPRRMQTALAGKASPPSPAPLELQSSV